VDVFAYYSPDRLRSEIAVGAKWRSKYKGSMKWLACYNSIFIGHSSVLAPDDPVAGAAKTNVAMIFKHLQNRQV